MIIFKQTIKHWFRSGSISILVMVFGLIAAVLIGGLVISTAIQANLSARNVYSEQALNVAEAGIEYYRWHLAHDPADFEDGTGASGPYEHAYTDPGGTTVGTFSLDIDPPTDGSTIVTITSTGWTLAQPSIKRAVEVTLGTPSLARFAFLHNSNVWFGHGMTISGPVLTNGGIRMDGINLNTIQTSKETYICGIETGCEPSEEKPGIWGNGGPQELWEYPVANIDFANININFASMKSSAETNGFHLNTSDTQGYHLVFNSDGSFTVYKVKTTDFYKGWSYDYECENLYQIIKTEELIGTYQVTDAPIIFIEDTLWVEGTLNGKTTVVAAKFPIDSYQKDIWIPDNLVYVDRSGDHVLGLIAQRDIAFTKDVPDDFEVDGALLAQSSRVLRHHYNYHSCKQGNPAMKNSLTIYGGVISNLISYWNFSGGGSEQPTSGFVKRDIIYDSHLLYEPPPYFPSSGVVELISWNEVRP
jgi:hypothetical protein